MRHTDWKSSCLRLLLCAGLATLAHEAPAASVPDDTVRGLLQAGRDDEAISLIEGRLASSDAASNQQQCALIETLNEAHRFRGDPFSARHALENASRGSGTAAAAANLSLAEFDLADGAPSAAAERIGKQLAAATSPQLHRQALQLSIRVAVEKRDPVLAHTQLQAATRDALDVANTPAQAVRAAATLAELMETYPALQRDTEAVKSLHTALAKHAANGDGLFAGERVQAWYALALLYRISRQNDQALRAARTAASLASAAELDDQAFFAWTVVGQLLRDQDAKRAAQAFDSAMAAFERARTVLVAESALDARGIRQRLGSPFIERAGLALQEAQTTGGGEADRLRWYAVETMERFKRAELQQYFLNACAGAQLASRPQDLARVLPSGTRVFYPIVFTDRIEVLGFDRSGIRQYTVVGAADLEKWTREFRAATQSAQSKLDPAIGKEVFRQLIQPVLASGEVDHLLVIPDAFIRLLPFAALPTANGFLVEQLAISSAPLLMATGPRDFANESPGSVIAGLSESVQGFPALPGVGDELTAIGRLMAVPESAALRDGGFRLAALKVRLDTDHPRILHLATHGEIGRRADQSYLLTYDDRIRLNQLDSLLRGSNGAPIELLTLSACQTASGDDRAALGLGGVALQAGADRVLATLWYVSDAATATLMPDFYDRLLKQNKTAAQSLREAQIALMHSERFAHPAYWAPYTLIERLAPPAQLVTQTHP